MKISARHAVPLFFAAGLAALMAGDLPGLRPDGSVLLPNQWSLRPAGKQIPLGDLPVNIALHPAGRFAAVLHCGHGRHEIIIVDIGGPAAGAEFGQGRHPVVVWRPVESKVVARVAVRESFYGLAFSPDGRRLYCSGAGDEVLHVFDFNQGQLKAQADIPLRAANVRGIPCGLAVSRDGRGLFAANVWGQSVSRVDLAARTNLAELFFTASGAAGEKMMDTNQPALTEEQAMLTKRAEAPLDPSSPDAPFPYACLLDEKRDRLYVSLWARACVAVVDLKSFQVAARWAAQEHPNEMALTKSGRFLFVANANRNSVTVLDTATGRAAETLEASLSPAALPGSTPNSLALSPDNTKLFVANACNNNIAVFDVAAIGHSRSLGFIPVGWYPTSVRVTPDGRRLLVANGRGLSSKANPKGPQPGKRGDAYNQYIADLFPGALSIIDLPAGGDWRQKLAAWTAQSYQCAPQPGLAAAAVAADNPVPAAAGRPSPIKYCIYIIKENRTYDQFLGDLPQGNGDPSLCLFPEKVTPNQHKLAADFVLLDNFYVDAIVSADGHEWSMGAYASDFVNKTWPLNYGHNRSRKYPYPSEGGFAVAAPAEGYLWDRAREAGVTYRSYGEFVDAGKRPGDPNWTKIPALQGHFDPEYHVFDLSYADVKRADRFIAELHRFEGEGEMPRLQIVRLPNDHTSGTQAGAVTPTACMADNDLALGRLVEAVSHSRFWPQTAIFVLEDDAQNGPDHVDAHRSPAFVISPYARRGAVDSTMYSTCSMLRTMELILGLKPMSQFDAAAHPMFQSFQAAPDLRPYDALPARVNLNERNTPVAWGAGASQKMDFTREDAADETTLNEIIWRSVRGAAHPMPAPRHAAFVFAQPKSDDDD
ncbi:MAG TPA: beta-propeller fold lactonase family protein [Candidatus Acidoferrum sp.]|nr:beta-propeller fold lactonase family protein [Candidatus Acidoferrum sp.]